MHPKKIIKDVCTDLAMRMYSFAYAKKKKKLPNDLWWNNWNQVIKWWSTIYNIIQNEVIG